MLYLRKNIILIKAISITIIIAFLYSNTVWAQGGNVGVHKIVTNLPSTIIDNLGLKTDLLDLNIPENLGKVKEIFKTESIENKRSVFHIQDSHANYEAQTNIAKILEHIISKHRKAAPKPTRNHYKSNGYHSNQTFPPILIAVEGAKGGIDTSMFYKIPVMEIRDMLADFFMEEGIINGAEYFDAMTRDKHRNPPFLVWGVEDKETYIENVKYFKKVHESKGPVQKFVRKYLRNILQITSKQWNKEQKQYFDMYYKYQDDEIGLEEYAGYINQIICHSEPRRGEESLR